MNKLADVDWSTIPAPEDDGGTDHLAGMRLPAVNLNATNGESIDLSSYPGLLVVYAYPMTGVPGTALPEGWDSLPGARGCTPQSCAFRDHADELSMLGVDAVFGLSTQSSEYQREAAERLQLPFQLLSDESLTLSKAIDLPTFEVDGVTLIKRLSLILEGGVIKHVFYPVFPPDANAAMVIDWLKSNPA